MGVSSDRCEPCANEYQDTDDKTAIEGLPRRHNALLFAVTRPRLFTASGAADHQWTVETPAWSTMDEFWVPTGVGAIGLSVSAVTLTSHRANRFARHGQPGVPRGVVGGRTGTHEVDGRHQERTGPWVNLSRALDQVHQDVALWPKYVLERYSPDSTAS
jgi:hypothetical protein